MPNELLHRHKDFAALIRIVGEELAIDPVLVEKDYWIMHCLYGLQQMGLAFQLKGGTSLSKGFGIIERFFRGHRYSDRSPCRNGRGHQSKSAKSRTH